MRVVKVGGRVQRDPAFVAAIAALWRAAPGTVCVVHGGGDEVSALQRRLGIEPTFVAGRRVTTPGDIELLRMALSGAANKRLVAALAGAGAPAVGVSGEDGSLLAARVDDTARLGLVARAPVADTTLARHLLAGGFLPVISPVSRDATGRAPALNVNADDAAAAIAVDLGAQELLLVADVPGLLIEGAVIGSLDADLVPSLIASGDASAGMVAKLEAAVAALEGGVLRVVLGDVSMLSQAGRGTTLSPTRSFA